jgi:uncharacterized protein (DUF433 family)
MAEARGADVLRSYRYDAPTAARLVGLHPARVRRWLFGYKFVRPNDGALRRQRPVVGPARDKTGHYASFLDLIELLSVKAFLDRGQSLQKVRAAHSEAAALLKADHPFARKGYLVLGEKILLEMNPPDGIRTLELVSGGQWTLSEIVGKLAERIDFDADTELASRWWPLGRNGHVVVDPRVAFGSPSVAGHGIRTSVVYQLFEDQGRKIEPVEEWTSLKRAEIRAAVKWEEMAA